MGIAPSAKTKAIRETLERFPDLGNRTIARIVLHNYGDLYENDIEKIRAVVRYYRGAIGNKSRTLGKKEYVKPPVMPATWRQKRTPYYLSPGLWAIFPDVHVPFHEPAAVESAVAYAKKNKVNGVFFPGDLQDCAAVSYWTTGRKRDFDREIEATIDFLDFIKYEFPKQKKVVLPGNHEYRLPRYYQTRAPELMGIPLAAMDKVLDFEARGFEYLEYNQLVYAGKLPILHGHEVRRITSAVNPARGLFLKIRMWGMCGHCHKTSENSEKDLQGTLLTTWSVGCLCDLSPDYDPYTNGWNWGFALVNVEKDGHFEVENKRILSSGKVV